MFHRHDSAIKKWTKTKPLFLVEIDVANDDDDVDGQMIRQFANNFKIIFLEQKKYRF